MKLSDVFLDAKKGYYRNFAFIENSESVSKSLQILKGYLKVNPKASIAYAFHPWVEGSKERLNEFRKIANVVDIDYSSSEKYLGSTFDVVILDCIDDFRPNYIARLSDMARGGGLIILYSDNISKNKLYKSSLTRNGVVKDLFEKRFLEKVLQSRGIIYVGNKEIIKPYSSSETFLPKKKGMFKIPKRLYDLCITDDQAKVIEEFNFIEEEGKRTFAVIAPRGRGKSVAIGLSISNFIIKNLDNSTNIVITSPSYYAASELIEAIVKGLRTFKVDMKISSSKEGKIMGLRAGNVRVKWTAPEIAKDEDGDIIVIDEAASLGIENLDYILRRWEKVVMVTTIHGYEGSGKAFLKYINNLEKMIKFQMVKLDYPIRYAKGDPIEKLIYDIMLLDAEPENMECSNDITQISQETLFDNEKLLRQIYGILVSAHYRNSPDDLMLLGDMAFQKIFVASQVAVAQVVEEGGLSDNEIKSILYSEGNEGHLIPQRIIKYQRLRNFGELRGWRIMRIAVMPSLQNKGIGSLLLNKIYENALDLDWIGSSFVLDKKVLNFWLKNGFTPVFLASKKNEGLGGYSVIVLKGISEKGKKVISFLSSILKDKILRTSHQVYFNVNPSSLVKILRSTPPIQYGDIPDLYKAKIIAYLNGILPYNSTSEAIHSLATKYFFENKFDINEVSLASLFARTFQGKSWYHAGLSLGLKPREVEENVKNAISEIFGKYYDYSKDFSIF
jgi:tRNA(Met) cytidine acetyltransferase